MDDGSGIDPGHIPRLNQALATRDYAGHTGLGLMLADMVARIHGGRLEILTPDEAGMYAGITSFRFSGKTSSADNNAIVTELRDQYGVLTVRRGGVAKGNCIRHTLNTIH